MHRLCQRAFRLLYSRPTARYHICPPCTSKLCASPFASSPPRHGKDNDFVVRYFEETEDSKFKRIEEHEQEQEAERLRTRIKELEVKIKSLSEAFGKSGRDVPDLESLTKDFPAEEDADANAAEWNNAEKLLEEEPDLSNLDVGLPQYQTAALRSFNQALRAVAQSPETVKTNAILWTKYIRCKQKIPEFLGELSASAWEVLWQSQYSGNPVMESRMRHLWDLVDDMSVVGRELTATQTLIQIESMFSTGNKAGAIKLWQSCWDAMSKTSAEHNDFRDLGIRLYADLGRLKEATMLTVGTAPGKGKPRAQDVATVISAWTQKGDEASLKVAWSLYLDLRRRLQSQMTLDDYDHIVMAFLNSQKISLALAVFKDMVLFRKRPDWDSVEMAKKSTALYSGLMDGNTGLDDLTQVSLASLIFLPKSLENKYFYASWIKRLLGMGEVDCVVSVLALMYERGIRPDAIHLNGLISAWFRGDDKQKQNLALQVAWSMVKERLKFVARRDNSDQQTVETPDLGVAVPPYISENLPPATIETFSILLLYYENRGMHTSMEIVQQMLQEARIPPNSFFMNHLLHAEYRQGDVDKAWEKFLLLRKSIKPDLATFTVLWECSKISTAGRSLPAKEFPSPRAIFASMTEWLHAQTPRAQSSARDTFNQAQYNLIVRCFCFRRDMEGTIVALYALRDLFSRFPDAETIRLITVQLARMGEHRSTSKHRRTRLFANKLSANKESLRNMAKIAEIFRLVDQRRADALRGMGVADEEEAEALSQEQRGEELLYKLGEVLRIFMRHVAGSDIAEASLAEQGLEKLAWDIGVGGVRMDAPVYGSGDEDGSALVARA